MVRGFAMESQDKRMCKTESVFPGVTIDYNHRAYDEDCFNDILNLFDFPMESLEGDGFAEDWASKLGPIPSEVFKELMPPGPQTAVGNNFSSSADLPFEYPVLNNRTSHLKYQLNRDEEVYHIGRISQLKQHPTFVEEKRVYPSQASPNSVLESRSSSSNNNNNNSTDNTNNKGVSFGMEILIPARSRSKRRRPTTNPWLRLPFTMLTNKDKKGRKPSLLPVFMETKTSLERADVEGIKKCAHCEITKTPQWREGPMGPKTLCNACGVRYRSGRLYPEYRPAASLTFVPALLPIFKETKTSFERADVAGIKKCAHCEITKTPQWREGPMGPKTLCNACGVRYRSGRLYPEYRPAASPTFVPALHSNSHRKVIEMRQKAVK